MTSQRPNLCLAESDARSPFGGGARCYQGAGHPGPHKALGVTDEGLLDTVRWETETREDRDVRDA